MGKATARAFRNAGIFVLDGGHARSGRAELNVKPSVTKRVGASLHL